MRTIKIGSIDCCHFGGFSNIRSQNCECRFFWLRVSLEMLKYRKTNQKKNHLPLNAHENASYTHLDLFTIWILICWVIRWVLRPFRADHWRENNVKFCQNDKIAIFIGWLELVTVHISFQYRCDTICNLHKTWQLSKQRDMRPIIDLYDYYFLVACLMHFFLPHRLVLTQFCFFFNQNYIIIAIYVVAHTIYEGGWRKRETEIITLCNRYTRVTKKNNAIQYKYLLA